MLAVAAATVLVAGAGCQAGSSAPASTAPGANAMTISITSSAFKAGEPIPAQYTADGKDISPPLAWTGAPRATKEFVLICDDPDAPSAQPWVHWVMYKIPADTKSLAEAIPRETNPPSPAGAVQGINSFGKGKLGYLGPSPPKGKPHHYHFHLYALDTTLPATPGLDKEKVLAAMKGHMIGEGELIGTYQR
ncbi:MAG TPA: YbhB/YbcL family Raf kinase inhibitor-like protein [Pirellulales bacterium]|jgi:hypothetical protein|nr:YbhB/YbcL family Raf kinase inhibitor-like protein [Pirellulales bacterium]